MTPLLWDIMQSVFPRRDEMARGLYDLIMREDLHSFLCTPVLPLLEDPAIRDEMPEMERMFLPAPASWFEFFVGGDRFAYFIADETEDRFNTCAYAFLKGRRGVGELTWTNLGPLSKGELRFTPDPWIESLRITADRLGTQRSGSEIEDAALSMQQHVRWTLDCINTPGVIGLHVHDAHKGRMRRLRGLGVGSFPLGAWTELKIGHPTKDKGGQIVESHEADRRPLHFVRSHLKPSLGNRRVPAHWRGNAAYGIKRHRYKVENRHEGRT